MDTLPHHTPPAPADSLDALSTALPARGVSALRGFALVLGLILLGALLGGLLSGSVSYLLATSEPAPAEMDILTAIGELFEVVFQLVFDAFLGGVVGGLTGLTVAIAVLIRR